MSLLNLDVSLSHRHTFTLCLFLFPRLSVSLLLSSASFFLSATTALPSHLDFVFSVLLLPSVQTLLNFPPVHLPVFHRYICFVLIYYKTKQCIICKCFYVEQNLVPIIKSESRHERKSGEIKTKKSVIFSLFS